MGYGKTEGVRYVFLDSAVFFARIIIFFSFGGDRRHAWGENKF